MKPPRITITVKIEQPGRPPWERSVSEVGAFPEHLAQQELFTIAHAQLHPARHQPAPRRD